MTVYPVFSPTDIPKGGPGPRSPLPRLHDAEAAREQAGPKTQALPALDKACPPGDVRLTRGGNRYHPQWAQAVEERSRLTPQDQFEAHDLDSMRLRQLQTQLGAYGIDRAYLVKKRLRFFPEQPLYILLVRPHQADTQAVLATLGTQIAQELKFYGELLVRLTTETEPELVVQIQAQAPQELLAAALGGGAIAEAC